MPGNLTNVEKIKKLLNTCFEIFCSSLKYDYKEIEE